MTPPGWMPLGLAVVAACQPAPAAGGDRAAGAGAAAPAAKPPKRAGGFAAPTEAWLAAQKAAEAGDGGTYGDCQTPAAQNGLVLECLSVCW